MAGKTCLVAALLAALPLAAAAQERPRLILQITVDQLRGDLPLCHPDQFGKGGFRYLFENGIHYDDAHQAHANTETVVGHATLATGAHRAAHGMVGNLWFDRSAGRAVYNIGDPDYPLLSDGAGVDAETEIDPTQKAAGTDGRSPAAILTTTFSDELTIATQGRAKVFGVSVKDRGAVTMGGHTGTAFRFSKASGQFVTSEYHYDAYPGWVADWTAKEMARGYGEQIWDLLNPRDSYLFGDMDDQPWEPMAFGSFGTTMPKSMGPADHPLFITLVTLSPFGDQMTANFAKTLIDAEGLGDDPVTGFLGVSFSATDYIGHFYGPSSLEAEDNLLRLDRTLADLFAYVDTEIGLDKTLIVLSADHGAPEAPGYLRELGNLGGYVTTDMWDDEAALERIRDRFALSGKIVEGYDHPHINLTDPARSAEGVDPVALETAIAEELTGFDGVAYAIPSSRLRAGALPDNALTRAVLNNFNPDRSADIYSVFNPGWFINDFDGLSVTVTRGSPWRYDTFVPVFFAGNGLVPQTVSRRVHTVHVATTLAAIADTRPPDGAAGEVLPEVVGQ